MIPGLGGSPKEGNGYPLQYSCLEKSMDRGAWQAPVHGVKKSQTQLSDFHFQRISLVSRMVKRLPTMPETRGSNPGSGRSPGAGKWQPTPLFLPGKSHGQKSLVGYSSRGRKESDTTEQLHYHYCLKFYSKHKSAFKSPHDKVIFIYPWIR